MAGRSKGVSTSDVGTRGEPGFPGVMTWTRGGVSGKLVFSRLSGLPPSLLLARKLQESIHLFRSNWWCRPPGHLPLSAAQVGQTVYPLTGVTHHPGERLFFLMATAMDGEA